jgi:hypothetical protein
MQRTKNLWSLISIVALLASTTFAQQPNKQGKNQSLTPQAAAGSVTGSGTPGRLSRWTGVDSSNTFTLGNSNIFEDKFGKIGIGTTTPTSLLTIQGMVETTLGGYKFPDGTIQTTAFNPNQVVRSLNGLTGNVTLAAGANITITPGGNTLTIAAANALTGVAHDTTLTGNGTAASPLGVAVPLVLSGAAENPNSVVKITNTSGGVGLLVENTSGAGTGLSIKARTGVLAVGIGDNATGVFAEGGFGASGGTAVSTEGGLGFGGNGGAGLEAFGGGGTGAGASGGDGIIAAGASGINGAASGLAGRFMGNVSITSGNLAITGNLSATGTKMFKIDHPLDPENKYLNHAAIESSEVLNVYSGNVTTNANGDAIVSLPDWFEALNRDFRYQLTVLGQFAQAIVAEKIKGNRFAIKSNGPNVEVSWQVTGVRNDRGMQKHPFTVEEAKVGRERGSYLTPEAFDQSEEKGIEWARNPEIMQRLKQQRFEAEEKIKRQKANER